MHERKSDTPVNTSGFIDPRLCVSAHDEAWPHRVLDLQPLILPPPSCARLSTVPLTRTPAAVRVLPVRLRAVNSTPVDAECFRRSFLPPSTTSRLESPTNSLFLLCAEMTG